MVSPDAEASATSSILLITLLSENRYTAKPTFLPNRLNNAIWQIIPSPTLPESGMFT